ncbi:high mobility group, HMG1/HMG2 [Pochonia chlamydosporia 170]|uniref:High mobility group, HMG1/HMG2 n=1 Tax=Pochonia chlamydosporia 170 TaxID=1380566 RepID=A0A179FZ62_METCM|nr:high mobility group, HMG1/HMG2 [Pochonia chlamydosporia 170]OAQ70343.1 high mobility group, HMG1/HMG2 [Pochonia chlamydosporia 170]
MPPKRKFADIEPEPSAVPPSLPPSVEEAYRRKCVQLKNRTNEVEDANDAARLRLARIKRQVEKLRIERAFLLEQLAKRTSTNVEDSEGSPSPPPTPKDKPLRIKRGHRKSALLDLDSKATPNSSFKELASPSESQAKRGSADLEETPTNGVSKPSKAPKSAFDLYCEDARPILEAKSKEEEGDGDGDINIEEELTRAWEDLPEAEKEEFQSKFEELSKKADEKDDDEDKDVAEDTPEKEGKSGDADKPETQDEDVEMTNYDTEDQEQDQDQDQDDDQDQDQDGETQMDKDGDD